MLRNASISLGIGLAAVSGSAALTSCTLGGSTPPEPDSFIAMALAARADAKTATDLSLLQPDLAAALATIASERSAHADALETELTRVSGPSTAPTEVAATGTEAPPPTIDALRAALADAQRAAAESARADSGYRAGIAGSISASCAAQNEVLLP